MLRSRIACVAPIMLALALPAHARTGQGTHVELTVAPPTPRVGSRGPALRRQ